MACHSGSTQPRTPVPADSVDQHDSQTRVVVEGTSLYLLGTFDGGTPALVEGALDSSAEVDTLVFTVNGGSIDDDATLSLGRRLRERGIRTMVVSEGVIASGGVSLFLSGVDRTVERGAKIGVHSWQHCWGDADGQEPGCRQAMDHPRDDPGHDLHGDYTSEMLGSRDFYWFAIGASPSDSIHWMTDAEIERFGLSSNGVVDASSPNPFGPAFDQARADVLGSG
ncbi:MAG: hypothetical protein AAGA54_08610 [Myxococcota bacterium]